MFVVKERFPFRNDAVRHFEAEDDPDFDPVKADRNKDGEISSWERTVGNAVAKSMREQKSAEQQKFRLFYSVIDKNTGEEIEYDQIVVSGSDMNDAINNAYTMLEEGGLDDEEYEVYPNGMRVSAESFGAELTGSEFYPVGEGRIIGSITGDSQFSPLGANAEEDVKMQRRMKAKKRTQDRKQARRMKARKYENMAMAAEYASPYGERQTTDFGMVGGGNDFGQNRAEMMEEVSRSMSGGRMWVTTAMLAIGFVAGIAFKDMKQDTSSE